MISRGSLPSHKSRENNTDIYDYRPNVNFNYFIYDQTFKDSMCNTLVPYWEDEKAT